MCCFFYRQRITAVLLLTIFLSLVVTPVPALAHARIEVGPYVIIVGWVEEPVIVGERNAILIEVTQGRGAGHRFGRDAGYPNSICRTQFYR